jgi:RNA polymerase sigma-70 factor (ECF subfamily)
VQAENHTLELAPSLPATRLGLLGQNRDWYRPLVLIGRDSSQTAAPPVSDDQLLVARAADGDSSALATLYDRFAPSMLAVGERILGSAREAEDLVHDVFLEAWLRARYYDPARGTVRTWLMMRLRSRALDRRRSAQRARSVDLDELRHEGKPSDSPPGSGVDARRLHTLLADLAPDQRTVLELSYFEGHSCSEIATALGVPLGTVKSRMARAIAQLRTSLHTEPRNDP